MGKCFFSGYEAEVAGIVGHDGASVRVNPFGHYLITGLALAAYSGSKALSDLAKFNCLREIVNLNRDGLIPFWTVSSEVDPPNKDTREQVLF